MQSINKILQTNITNLLGLPDYDWHADDTLLRDEWLSRTHWSLTDVEPRYKIPYWTARLIIGMQCMTIGCIMLFHRKFKRHPYRLYAIDLIFLSAYFVSFRRLLFDFNVYEPFRWFLYWFLLSLGYRQIDHGLMLQSMKTIFYWSWGFQFISL